MPASDIPASDAGALPRLVTKSQFADELGVSRPYVSKLVAQQRLPMEGELILREEAMAVLGRQPDTADRPHSYSDAALRKLNAEADLAELKLSERVGTLVERAEVERLVGELFSFVRDRMLSTVWRAAGKVLPLKTEREVAQAIRDDFETELRAIVDTIKRRQGESR